MRKSKTRDFDPEELFNPAPSESESDSDNESVDDAQYGREHYADVGKSKLRKPEIVPLGPQYTGSRISRDAALDDDSDDPFSRAFGGEDSEDASDPDVMPINGANAESEDVESEQENLEDEQELEDGADGFEDEDEASDLDDDEEPGDGIDGFEDEDQEATDEDKGDEEEASSDEGEQDDFSRTKLRKIMNDQKAAAATISEAAQADVLKGNAVKAQRATFDTLLHARIRSQRGLASMKSLAVSTAKEESEPPVDAVQAAEAAAMTLLTALTNFRSALDSARAGSKRKRAAFTAATPSADIMSSIRTAESQAQPHRDAVLEKWSSRTKGPVRRENGRLNDSAGQQSLTDVLRMQVNKATTGAKQGDLYDDAPFYSLLLRDLLAAKSADGGAGSDFVVSAPWQAAREAKTKKVVDTRASKGRRVRYTVHEKLENFMAPEKRSVWETRQTDELFGSLFGHKMALGEDVEEDEKESEDEGMEEEGLKLFRS